MPDRPLRVLRVITRLNVGGPTRHVRLLMDGLDPNAFEQRLVHGPCPAGEGAGVLTVPGESVCIDDLVRPLSPRRDQRAARALLTLMREWRPDVVHTHQGKAGFLGRMAARKAGVRAIVHTYHGHTFVGYHSRLLGALLKNAERRAAAVSNALICQSESQEHDVLLALGRSAEGKTVRIDPAIDPSAIATTENRESARRRFRIDDSMRVILFPARLVPIKRPHLAIEILARLRRADVQLWMLGDGPLAPSLRGHAADLGVASAVRILPEEACPAALMLAADLTLLTSRAEGTPLSLIEAAALGCPVASTAVGGVFDLIGDYGTLLDPTAGPAEWARQLEPLLESRQRLTEGVRAGIKARHAPDRLVRSVAALYDRVSQKTP